jgi:transcriptional activator
MSVLRNPEISDILAATGKAGMQELVAEKFWSWRRIVLAVGYGLVLLTGVQIVFAADPTGFILAAAAILGVSFLHRTWLGVLVWTYVAISGVVALTSGDDLGLYAVLAGLGFALVALPIWRRRPATPRRVIQHWQPTAFEPPRPQPAPTPAVESTAVASAQRADEPQGVGQAGPMIQTVGQIRISTDSGDLTPSLLGKPVIGFLWLYLFARSVRKPGDRLTRTALTDEVAHRVSDPRGRLRGYLRDLTRLPEPLGSMVIVDDEMIGFDLQGHDADVVGLPRLADRIRQSNGAISDEDLPDAQRLLMDIGDGEFLLGFEDMERRVTKGRGVAGQVVAEVRAQVDTMRADLADSVANGLLDRGQAAAAVSLLEPIVARSEHRDDLARTLVNALRESGQHGRAAEVRRRFAVGQES